MNELSNDQYRLIEQFFNNELKQEDRPQFDLQMEDPTFREAVLLQKELQASLKKELAESPIMQMVKAEATAYKTKQQEVTPKESEFWKNLNNWINQLFNPVPRYAYALSILVLLVAGSFIWANYNYSNNSIVQALHDPILDDTQADIPTNKELLDKAKMAFFKEDFKAAISLFSGIEDNNQYYHEAQSLLAYSYFRNDQFDQAITQFNRLLEDGFYTKLPNSYKNENKLRWTRLLAYLGAKKTNETQFSEELNFFLTNKSEVYQKKAKVLESKMNSLWREFLL